MADYLPPDDAIRQQMQGLMKQVDLETMSTKQFIAALSAKFGGADLSSKKKFIKATITDIIDSMEKDNDGGSDDEEVDESSSSSSEDEYDSEDEYGDGGPGRSSDASQSMESGSIGSSLQGKKGKRGKQWGAGGGRASASPGVKRGKGLKGALKRKLEKYTERAERASILKVDPNKYFTIAALKREQEVQEQAVANTSQAAGNAPTRES